MKKEEGIWVSEGGLGEERAREEASKKNGERKRGRRREGRRKEGPGGGWSVEETAEGESFVLEN